MTYRVIKDFVDLHDAEHAYHVGDVFPREGIRVSASRISELSGSDNKRGIPLIEAVGKPKKEEVPEVQQDAGRCEDDPRDNG